MNNKFNKLFNDYGYTTQELGKNAYLAYNDLYCIAYSTTPHDELSGVCFDHSPNLISELKDYYNSIDDLSTFGSSLFYDYMKGKLPWHRSRGPANHDHSDHEVEYFLKATSNK